MLTTEQILKEMLRKAANGINGTIIDLEEQKNYKKKWIYIQSKKFLLDEHTSIIKLTRETEKARYLGNLKK